MNDTPIYPTPPRRRRWFRRGTRRPMTRRKKIILWIITIIIVAAVSAGGYLAYRALVATSKIVHGDVLSLLEPDVALQTDSQGRTNFLLFGTSQDDAAHLDAEGGGGLWLTDSIMLLSLDQTTHTVSMVSIPRDLWVSIPGGCTVGYQSKINAVYECGADLVGDDGTAGNEDGYAAKDAAGAAALESVVQTVTGVTPQYYVHVNYSVLKDVVDALGGIDVDIEGDGADGVYDTNFDWNCENGQPYTCQNVYYPTNGTYTLDGLHALYLARARSDAGLYSYKNFGLARGDYSRQINQQKILAAIQKKALSAGVLANPLKVTELLEALGDNITTDLGGGELKTLVKAMKAVGSDGIESVSLVTDSEAVVTSSTISGQSVQIATSGVLDYTSIVNYLASHYALKSTSTESTGTASDSTAGSE